MAIGRGSNQPGTLAAPDEVTGPTSVTSWVITRLLPDGGPKEGDHDIDSRAASRP